MARQRSSSTKARSVAGKIPSSCNDTCEGYQTLAVRTRNLSAASLPSAVHVTFDKPLTRVTLSLGDSVQSIQDDDYYCSTEQLVTLAKSTIQRIVLQSPSHKHYTPARISKFATQSVQGVLTVVSCVYMILGHARRYRLCQRLLRVHAVSKRVNGR